MITAAMADGIRRHVLDSDDKVRRIVTSVLGEVVARAAIGDSNATLYLPDYYRAGEFVSFTDTREIMGFLEGLGFGVKPSPMEGAIHIEWGDAVDEWWDCGL